MVFVWLRVSVNRADNCCSFWTSHYLQNYCHCYEYFFECNIKFRMNFASKYYFQTTQLNNWHFIFLLFISVNWISKFLHRVILYQVIFSKLLILFFKNEKIKQQNKKLFCSANFSIVLWLKSFVVDFLR